ncbi:mechanosensitive ion channel family protein [Thalassotalea marina]|uniref:Small-conductance mechanosensitive channel n=1 Tax=Thalassotalea marina TaxID=1673741 RepID=A0A919EJ86_9GAMM|nr:mechanosensitive ion channel family protein [Thalassotalea marina]GHF85782.1 mechanosensitive ion channel protein [Thalassotalea marina]
MNTEQATATDASNQAPNLDPSVLLQDELNLISHAYQVTVEFFTNYTFQLIGALIIFIIGFIIAGKIAKVVLKLCQKHNLDITLSQFLANTTKMIIVVLITIVALGKLGISVTPFIATIGALSLGAGLALQGLLANYAAGFNIILIRPFVVGDTITVQGVTGIVKEVLLAYTIIADEDNVEITIPNKHIVGEVLHNSKHDSLLELTVGIAYKEDPLSTIEILQAAIDKLDIVSDAKKPQIGIDEFADSSINIGLRIWTPTESLYDSKYKANKAIYQALKDANIEIPFPQRDVHLIQASDKAA